MAIGTRTSVPSRSAAKGRIPRHSSFADRPRRARRFEPWPIGTPPAPGLPVPAPRGIEPHFNGAIRPPRAPAPRSPLSSGACRGKTLGVDMLRIWDSRSTSDRGCEHEEALSPAGSQAGPFPPSRFPPPELSSATCWRLPGVALTGPALESRGSVDLVVATCYALLP